MATAFEGVLLKTGSCVEYSALWPTKDFPAKPVLLEYAGSDRTGWGHNRSNYMYVLWRFEPDQQAWVEIVRCLSKGSDWIANLMPIALREVGGPPRPDPEIAATATRRFFSQLNIELRELSAVDRDIMLNLVFEQLAARLVSLEN